MEAYIGRTSKALRDILGLTQKEMASQLGISAVHYCNIENDKSMPSAELLDRYREIWDVDLHVLGWSLFGDVSRLPKPLQHAAATISRTWKAELKKLAGYQKVAD